MCNRASADAACQAWGEDGYMRLLRHSSEAGSHPRRAFLGFWFPFKHQSESHHLGMQTVPCLRTTPAEDQGAPGHCGIDRKPQEGVWCEGGAPEVPAPHLNLYFGGGGVQVWDSRIKRTLTKSDSRALILLVFSRGRMLEVCAKSRKISHSLRSRFAVCVVFCPMPRTLRLLRFLPLGRSIGFSV